MTNFYNNLTRKVLLSLFIIFISMAGFSATYYVSSSGNDSNSGLSESLAWKTLTKVNSMTFSAGDRILFKAGDIWYGQFTPHGSGILGNNITFSSYGTGIKPEIRAYGEVPGWTNSGNWSLYSAGVYRMFVDRSYFNRLWINGSEKRHCATLDLTDDYPWAFSSSYLYVKAPSNPATYFSSVVMPNLLPYASVVQSVSNVEINGLQFTGGFNTFELLDCNNITIDNCEIGFRTELYGLDVYSSNGVPITNTIVRHCKFITGDALNYNYDRGYVNHLSTEDAIHLGNNCTNAKVYSNYFENWSHTAVYLTGNGTLSGNEVYSNFITAPNIDYGRGLGADYNSGSANSFHDNTIYNTSVRNQFNGNGLKIYNNIIDVVRGVPLRANAGQGLSIEAYGTPAINMEIYNNTIRNCAYEGIKLWGTNAYEKSYNNIHDNNLINNGASANNVQLSIWSPDLSTVHNNTYSSNHIYSSATVNTIEYEYITRTSASFNASTLNNGDVRSGNDAIIKYNTPSGPISTNNPSSIRIEHNGSDVAKTIQLTTAMIDSKGNKYSGSITLQPYSSVILLEDLSTPVAPGAPTSVVATAGNASATVTFVAPSNNGGSPITGYTVTSLPAGGTDMNAGSTSLSHTISGLTNGTAYTFTVKATNSVGTSVASAASNSVIPKAPLTVASAYTLTGPSSGSVNSPVSFTVTPNNSYTGSITITPTGTASAGLSPKVLTFSNSSAAQTFTITPTVSGSITLTATNNGGLINPASLSYVVTSTLTAPGAPTSVVATAGYFRASVTFAAPIDNGGSPVTGYTVTSIPSGGIDADAGSTLLTHTITGLTNGISYVFTVKATNSIGTSVASAPSNSVIPKTRYKSSKYLKNAEISDDINGDVVLNIDVFPNPSKGKVTVRFSSLPKDGSSINILDISGRRVASKLITQTSEEFNLEDQPAGVYFVNLILGENRTMHKIVITK